MEELVKGLINTPEQSAQKREEARIMLLSGMGGKGKKGIPVEDWLCKCGFKNTYRNAVCGGMGNMGCKVERAIGAIPGLGMSSGGANNASQILAAGYQPQQNTSSSKLKGVPC